jgi:hypothetical protein
MLLICFVFVYSAISTNFNNFHKDKSFLKTIAFLATTLPVFDTSVGYSPFFVLLIAKSKRRAINALPAIAYAVECKMFPKPDNGITMPPTRNVPAPRMAEAVPLYFSSKSSAKLVGMRKVAPAKNKDRKSVTQK